MKYYQFGFALIVTIILFGCKDEISINPTLDYDCSDTTLYYKADGVLDYSNIRFIKNNKVIRSIDINGYTEYTNYDSRGRVIKYGNIYDGIESYNEYIYGIYDTIREMRNSDGERTTYKYNKYRKLIETKGYLNDELNFESYLFYMYFDNAEITTIIATERTNTYRIKLYNSTVIPVSTDTMSHYSIYYYSDGLIDSSLYFNNEVLSSKVKYKYDSKRRIIYNEDYSYCEQCHYPAFKYIREYSYSDTDKLNWRKSFEYRQNQGEASLSLISSFEMVYKYNESDNLFKIEFYRMDIYNPSPYQYYILVDTEEPYKYYRQYSMDNIYN